MTDIDLPYTETFRAIGDAVNRDANGIGISVKKFQAAFQPVLHAIVAQACAAEIEAAREEVRRAGMMEAAESMRKTSAAWARLVGSGWFDPSAMRISQEIAACAAAIEAKAKEAGR